MEKGDTPVRPSDAEIARPKSPKKYSRFRDRNLPACALHRSSWILGPVHCTPVPPPPTPAAGAPPHHEVRTKLRLKLPGAPCPPRPAERLRISATEAEQLSDRGSDPPVSGPLVPGEALQGLRLPLHQNQRQDGPADRTGGRGRRTIGQVPAPNLPK